MAEATKRRLVFASLRGYQRSSLRSDVLAGLTVWAPVVDCCNDARSLSCARCPSVVDPRPLTEPGGLGRPAAR
jgi:hypothetical protein